MPGELVTLPRRMVPVDARRLPALESARRSGKSFNRASASFRWHSSRSIRSRSDFMALSDQTGKLDFVFLGLDGHCRRGMIVRLAKVVDDRTHHRVDLLLRCAVARSC